MGLGNEKGRQPSPLLFLPFLPPGLSFKARAVGKGTGKKERCPAVSWRESPTHHWPFVFVFSFIFWDSLAQGGSSSQSDFCQDIYSKVTYIEAMHPRERFKYPCPTKPWEDLWLPLLRFFLTYIYGSSIQLPDFGYFRLGKAPASVSMYTKFLGHIPTFL